ncbi:DTW domain-containing protein, partial [Burkholderia sp. SIMBA_045]
SHAVYRLRDLRMARVAKQFFARGSRAERRPPRRAIQSHCLCPWRPKVVARSAMCLVMHDVEPLKPSNTGWLIADVVRDNHAFIWSRTEVDEQLLALLADPQ